MPFIDKPAHGSAALELPLASAEVERRRLLGALSVLAAAALSGCEAPRRAPPSSPASPAPPSAGGATTPRPPTVAPGVAPPPSTALARNWNEYKVLAARRLVQANPDITYLSAPPDPLLAIPVLEVELYVDGSIQAIKVTRQPTQATDTVQLAINAVRRAAPFPAVGHLPKPWRFTEVFLFDERRRFKPRTLDN